MREGNHSKAAVSPVEKEKIFLLLRLNICSILLVFYGNADVVVLSTDFTFQLEYAFHANNATLLDIFNRTLRPMVGHWSKADQSRCRTTVCCMCVLMEFVCCGIQAAHKICRPWCDVACSLFITLFSHESLDLSVHPFTSTLSPTVHPSIFQCFSVSTSLWRSLHW